MKLSLLTYNIHRAIGLDGRFRPERIVEVLQHHDADVVLLQEVDDGAPRSRKLDLAAELASAAGYEHFAAGYNVRLSVGRYGNATLSRHPIVEQRNIDLTISRLKKRGCLHTRLLVQPAHGGNERPIDVFNLHLGLSAMERSRQVRRLLSTGEFERLDSTSEVVVAGDFNDWRSLLWPVFVTALGFRCATQTDADRPTFLRTYPTFSPRGALDRFYYRGQMRATEARVSRLKVARVASDHLPVTMELEVR